MILEAIVVFCSCYGAIVAAIYTCQHGDGAEFAAKAADNIRKHMGSPVALQNAYGFGGSKPLGFSFEDVLSVVKHAVFAAVAGAVAYLSAQWLPLIDQTTDSGILIFGIASVVLKFVSRLLSNTEGRNI